jgi:hypothetical protein
MRKHPRPLRFAHQRGKNEGFSTLITTLVLGIEKGRLSKKTVAPKRDIYKINYCSDAPKPLILLGFSKSSVSPLVPFITDNIDIVSKRPAVAGLFDASEPVPQYRSSVDISRGFAVFP